MDLGNTIKNSASNNPRRSAREILGGPITPIWHVIFESVKEIIERSIDKRLWS